MGGVGGCGVGGGGGGGWAGGYNFNLEGPVLTIKQFSVACNELFHLVHLTQKYFSAKILPIVPLVN